MKAYKRKGGRPRRQDAIRTVSGQISRGVEQTEREKRATMNTAITARMKMLDLKYEDAKSQEAGSVLGLLFLDGKLGIVKRINGAKDATQKWEGLSYARYMAGQQFARDYARYYGLTGIQFPSPKAQNLFSVHGYDGDVTASRADAARTATARVMKLEEVLSGLGGQGRSIQSAVKSICLYDIAESRGWPAHMFRLLNQGLDELIVFYGLHVR